MKVVVAGGSGFLGRALIEELATDATEVVLLTRSPKSVPKSRTVVWDGVSGGPWQFEVEGADAVVNFSGHPILSRWSRANKERIVESRVNSTLAIGEAIASAKNPPRVWINGSATGFYGDRGSKELDESEGVGSGFLASVCEKWESATTTHLTPETRTITLRTGLVFDRNHPPLSVLAKLAKLYLGGCIGDGNDYLPWIHVTDHARMVRFCIEHELSGPINAVAPEPVTNRELMVLLRHELNRPWSPPVPKLLIKVAGAFGFPSEAILSSTRAIPAAAETTGFRWLCRKPDHVVSNSSARKR